MLAALIGFLGDFDLAEEAAQEAFAIAAERWPRDGAPDNPGAWLVATVSEAYGPAAGLAIVDRLPLPDYRYLHSTRAEMLNRLGRVPEAQAAYRQALALVHDDAERRLFERRLATLGSPAGSPAGRG